jgi:hypothetical protein
VAGAWLGDLYGRQQTFLALQQITVVTFWSRVQSGISLPSRRGSAETLPTRSNPRARRSGTMEISLAGGTRVCVRGEMSPETLRQLIELFR